MQNDYKGILEKNIYKPISFAIDHDKALNKMRSAFANAYNRAVNEKGIDFAKNAYDGDISSWSEKCVIVGNELANCQKLFGEMSANSYMNIEENNNYLQMIIWGLQSVREIDWRGGE